MSMLNRWSSRSMTARKLRTFQPAMRRAGVFVVDGFLLLSGAEFYCLLVKDDSSKRYAPSRARRQWRDDTLLAGGCPA